MQTQLEQAIEAISQVVLGKKHQIKLALTCLLAKGHLLIEDLPGMGKTSLSQAIASTIGLEFNRVQFTSDLMPADIIGISIFDNTSKEFAFHKGPLFSQMLLADEINRASPKTQSALLEAMEEHQVSVDGTTWPLPNPFFVIATQNPLHQSGTYPLPESQLDRFFMRIQLGYPDWQSERQMLMELTSHSTMPPKTIIDTTQFLDIQSQIPKINTSAAVIDYILRLVTFSRESEEFPNPLSPRASKAILLAAKAWAFLSSRDYVIPEDVQAVLPSVAEHRLRSSFSSANAADNLSNKLMESVDTLAA
ncbi:AAA family ATPase [Planctobacterium marinum]|uniref:AAA family ATPase n=1 Tax=Planctobacterium marinum TaxID=1631968 RepID=UPI001E2F9F91|nr:MoxR family ATPase [Planctobacterium marinum]MCC2603909.1 MoxR family ATPase [Planctobacterium marinum]